MNGRNFDEETREAKLTVLPDLPTDTEGLSEEEANEIPVEELEEDGKPRVVARPNILVLGGGLNAGMIENDDGQHVPAVMIQMEFAILIGNKGADALAKALGAMVGLKIIEAPVMAIPKGDAS